MEERASAIRALSLLTKDSTAIRIVKDALSGGKPQVRAAAAKSLGVLDATEAVPDLERASEDKDVSVSARVHLRRRGAATTVPP